MDYRSRYKQEVSKYGKKDAIIALCVYPVLVAITLALFVIFQTFEFTGLLASIFQFSLPAITIGIVFTIVLVKKQGLASIGLHKDRVWQMLRFSFFIILFYSAFGVVPGLINGWEFNNFGALIPILITTIILAVFEDIFFVGYLQTRLYGLVKKNALAIFAGATLFALIHIPVDVYIGARGIELVALQIGRIIMHLAFVLIFRRHFSLIPVSIAHTLSNFFGNGDLWRESDFDVIGTWATIATLLILVILVTGEIVHWRRSKREEGEKHNEISR